jgi:hypothetical protein
VAGGGAVVTAELSGGSDWDGAGLDGVGSAADWEVPGCGPGSRSRCATATPPEIAPIATTAAAAATTWVRRIRRRARSRTTSVGAQVIVSVSVNRV